MLSCTSSPVDQENEEIQVSKDSTQKTEWEVRAQRAAQQAIRLCNQTYPSDPQDPWKNLAPRQVLRDCLETMLRQGLIADYDLLTGAVRAADRETN